MSLDQASETADPDEESSIGFASVFVKVEIKNDPDDTFDYQDEYPGYQDEYQDDGFIKDGEDNGYLVKRSSEDEDNQPLIKLEPKPGAKKRTRKQGKIKCPYCPYRARASPLKNHMRKHTNAKEFQCGQCDYRTNYSTALLRHQKAKHSVDNDPLAKKKVYVKKYQCAQCDYKTAHNHALKSHMLGKHTTEKPHQCEYCEYKTKYSTALHRHRQYQHKDLLDNLAPGEKPTEFKCSLCDYKTYYEGHLTSHQSTHKATTFSCNLCSFESGIRDVFLMHIQEHSLKSLEQSGGDVCGMGMENIKNISDAILSVIQGMKLERNEEPPPPPKKRKRAYNMTYMCDNCDYHTPYKVALEYHMRKHDSSKPFKCDTCDYRTKYPTSIHRHKTIQHLPKPTEATDDENQKVKNHACELCEYRTYYKNNLKAHMRKHSIDKPFKCETCPYETAYRHCYLKHLKSHDDKGVPTTYRCDKCPFYTKHEGRMSWHLLRIHNEVRDLNNKCPHCDFSTKTKWRLTVHLQRSRLLAPLKCLSCDFETFFKCENKFHRQKHLPPIEAYEMVAPSTNIAHFLEPNNPLILENAPSLPQTPLVDQAPLVPQTPLDPQTPLVPQSPLVAQTPLLPHSPLVPHTPLVPQAPLALSEVQMEEATKNYQSYFQDMDADYQVIPSSVDWKKIQVLECKDNEKPFSCTTCPYNSRFKAAVQRHWQRMHGGKARPFKCNHCEFSTTTKDAIALHSRRSKLGYEMNCPGCDYRTRFKCAFISHQKIHNAFRCSICTYSCRKKYDLEKHYLMHSGAGFKCRFCDYVTARKHGLMCHETVHTGIKPFKCRYCDYSATRQGQLENHIKRTHLESEISKESNDETAQIELVDATTGY